MHAFTIGSSEGEEVEGIAPRGSGLLRPYFRAGEQLRMDAYLSEEAGHYGQPIWSVPRVRIGASNMTYHKSVVIPDAAISQVRSHTLPARRCLAGGHCS